jgi:ribonuclease-3
LALIAAQKALPQSGQAAKKQSSRKKKSILDPSSGDEQLNLTLRA